MTGDRPAELTWGYYEIRCNGPWTLDDFNKRGGKELMLIGASPDDDGNTCTADWKDHENAGDRFHDSIPSVQGDCLASFFFKGQPGGAPHLISL